VGRIQLWPRASMLAAGLTSLVLSAALLEYPAHSRGAGGGTQASVNVAVVPEYAPKTYPGYYGIPSLPIGAAQLAAYHFTQLPVADVSAGALKSYDTVILYGIRWSDIPASAQAAINAFAQTGKVVIWDSDDTGSQNYSSFIHPFTTASSGENGQANDSVVSFPGGGNFLASDDPSSPYYLDPKQLVADRNMINDMNAMPTGTPNWIPALVASNKNIPHGGWPIAWSYGVIGNHTGLTVYSGIDADAFGDDLKPDYALKELVLQLAAPFRSTPDTSCAPSCQLAPAGGGKTYALCTFAKPVPTGWVHGRVPITLRTSIAAGITGKIATRSGRVLAWGRPGKAGLIKLVVQTHLLPSPRIARLNALVFVKGQQACTKPFRLKVDNSAHP
jgi:hypothetical protein